MEHSQRTRHRRRLANSSPPFEDAETLDPLEEFDWDEATGEGEAQWREVERSIGRLDSRRGDRPRRPARPSHSPPKAFPPKTSLTEAPASARYSAMFGAATFAPGVALLVWSFVAARTDLWSQGITLAVVGQGFLSIGLLLAMPSLWRRERSGATEGEQQDDAY